MKQYLNLLKEVLHGDSRTDRTGVGTIGIFGHQMRFDLSDGFPAVTTKKLAWKAVVSELLWFLEGSTDERRLCEILHGTRDGSKRTVWTDNANAPYWKSKAKYQGDLGRVYGAQWRDWESPHTDSIDQIANVIQNLKTNPFDRRHLVVAYNPGEIHMMALPPCHALFQFYVSSDMKLSCQLYQRSADVFLGVPFNIASYALLVHIIAAECDLGVGEFIWTGGDCHLYKNHHSQAVHQLMRDPLPLPTLKFEKKNIADYTVDDFVLVDYNHMGEIKAPMAV